MGGPPRVALTPAVLVGLILILLASSWIQFTTVRETHVLIPASADAASYMSYAYNLRTKGVYSHDHTWESGHPSTPQADAISPPGYPLFLVAFMGKAPGFAFVRRVEWAQAILGVLNTLLVFLLAAHIVPPRIACIPALLAAITPHLSTITTYVLTEPLFSVLLLLSAWTFVRAFQSTRLVPWVLAGTVFGLCCLVRPTLHAFLPGALLAVLAVRRWRPLLLPLSVAGLCWLALMLPWFVYQQSVPPDPAHPVLLRSTLYHGSFPDFMYQGQAASRGVPYHIDPHRDEAMDSYAGLRHVVGGRMAAEPLRYLRWYVLGKPRYFLSWDILEGRGDVFIYPVDASPYLSRPSFLAIYSLMFTLHWPLMILGVAGACMAWWPRVWKEMPRRAQIGLRVVATTLLVAIVLNMIGAPYPRYGIPFWSFAYIMAVALATQIWRIIQFHRFKGRRNTCAPERVAGISGRGGVEA